MGCSSHVRRFKVPNLELIPIKLLLVVPICRTCPSLKSDIVRNVEVEALVCGLISDRVAEVLSSEGLTIGSGEPSLGTGRDDPLLLR